LASVVDIRDCAQCGTEFVPPREHSRFCSAKCRIAWNQEHSEGPDNSEGALGWSIVAMRETTDRLMRAPAVDRRQAFSVISEAVWWVTMVDATLVRYHPDTYDAVLARSEATERQAIEDTFGGLRFVRNQMGYEADHDDFIQAQPSDAGAAFNKVAAWTWKPVARPAIASLSARGQDWEMARYRAYQAQLAGRPVGDTFSRASVFLELACDHGLSGN
jgi:hypothetical protein